MSNIVIGFDPSYLSKSGKQTHGTGYYWSGGAGMAKWGLEVATFAAIDPIINTAFHLNAFQTPPREELDQSGTSLLDHYASLITKNAIEFKKLSLYILADAYFSKSLLLVRLAKLKCTSLVD